MGQHRQSGVQVPQHRRRELVGAGDHDVAVPGSGVYSVSDFLALGPVPASLVDVDRHPEHCQRGQRGGRRPSGQTGQPAPGQSQQQRDHHRGVAGLERAAQSHRGQPAACQRQRGHGRQRRPPVPARPSQLDSVSTGVNEGGAQHRGTGQHHAEQYRLEAGSAAQRLDRFHRHLGGAGPFRPRGSRVGGLLDEERQPGREPDPAAAVGGQHRRQHGPGRGRPQPSHGQHRRGGRGQPDHPVVGVQSGGHHRRQRGQAHQAAPFDGQLREQPARGGQQHNQRVHAGLAAVADQEGRREGEHGRVAGRLRAQPAASRSPDRRGCGQREQPRQRAGREIGVPEAVEPDAEHRVVQEGVAVVSQRLHRVADRQRGDVHRERLVEPHRRRRYEAQSHAGRGRGGGDRPQRRVPSRWARAGGVHSVDDGDGVSASHRVPHLHPDLGDGSGTAGRDVVLHLHSL